MKYLRNFNENIDEVKIPKIDESFLKEIEALKYLPYKEFVLAINSRLGDSNFLTNIKNLSKVKVDKMGEYGEVTNVDIKAKYLLPTQSQIGIDESLSWLQNLDAIKSIIEDKRASIFERNRLLIANNKWILDGHHRHAFVYFLNPNATIPCININLPEHSANNIMKDVQLSIVSTYGALYRKESSIKHNLSQTKDDDIYSIIQNILQGDELEKLRYSYGQVDLTKMILKEFIIKESRDPNETDFLRLDRSTNIPSKKVIDKSKDTEDISDEKDEAFKKMDSMSDSDYSADKVQKVLDIAGIFDPTGLVDILNGVGYIYRGQYFNGVISMVSAVPGMDFAAKPLRHLAFEGAKVVGKNLIYKKSLQGFGKAFMKLDGKLAAKQIVKMENEALRKLPSGEFANPKLAARMGEITQTLEKVSKNMPSIVSQLGNVLKKLGDNFGKIRLFNSLITGKLIKFFQDLYNFLKYWRENLTRTLNYANVKETIDIVASNAVKLKRIIIDNQIDKLNTNFSIGINPLQIAIKTKMSPYSGEFNGVPELFLDNLPTILNNLKSTEITDLEAESSFDKDKLDEFIHPVSKDKQVKTKDTKSKIVKELPKTDSKVKPVQISSAKNAKPQSKSLAT